MSTSMFALSIGGPPILALLFPFLALQERAVYIAMVKEFCLVLALIGLALVLGLGGYFFNRKQDQ